MLNNCRDEDYDENIDISNETIVQDMLLEKEMENGQNKGGRPEKPYVNCGKTQQHFKIQPLTNNVLNFSEKESIPVCRTLGDIGARHYYSTGTNLYCIYFF